MQAEAGRKRTGGFSTLAARMGAYQLISTWDVGDPKTRQPVALTTLVFDIHLLISSSTRNISFSIDRARKLDHNGQGHYQVLAAEGLHGARQHLSDASKRV